jgi:hypothetical protein
MRRAERSEGTMYEPAETAAWNARGGGAGPNEGGTMILHRELVAERDCVW